jgi:hypothetical protein
MQVAIATTKPRSWPSHGLIVTRARAALLDRQPAPGEYVLELKQLAHSKRLNANRSSRKDDAALRSSQIALRDGVPSNPNQHKASGAWLAFKSRRGVYQFRLICSPLFRRLPL